MNRQPVRAPLYFVGSAFLSLFLMAGAVQADQVRVGDVVITKDGVKMPGIEVTKDGVKAGNTSVTSEGVQAGNLKVEASDDGAVTPSPTDRVSGPDWDNRTFQGTEMNGADLSNHSLRGATFQSADFNRVNFTGADLTNARLQSSDFNGSNFTSAIMVAAKLQSSDFNGANFSGANLEGAKLQSSDFIGANFRGACLINADIQTSDIDRADFTGANLTGAKLANNDQRGTIFEGAIFNGATSCGPEVDATNVRPDLTDAAAITTALAGGVDAKVDLTVNFDTDSDRIDGQAHAQVFEIAKALQSDALKSARIMIEGHTDNVGEADYNTDLSFRRAMSVMRALKSGHDVDPSRISIMGYGEEQPVASNTTEAGRALNRRVTLVRLTD